MREAPSLSNASGRFYLLLAATVAGFIALSGALRSVEFLQLAQTAEGTIQLEAGMAADEAPGHPLIHFTTSQGRDVTYRQNGGVWQSVGSRVAVLYDPRAPQETARVDGFWVLWGFPFVFPAIIALGLTAALRMPIQVGWRPGRY